MADDELYHRASVRVNKSPRLVKHREVILYDWSPRDEHLRWVVTAKVSEIEAWAQHLEDGNFGELKTA